MITVPLWWDGTNPSIVCPLSDTSFVVAHRQTLPSAGFLPPSCIAHCGTEYRNGLQQSVCPVEPTMARHNPEQAPGSPLPCC